MPELDNVQEPTATADPEAVSAIDAAHGAEDGPARSQQPPHAMLLADAKRYRKRAQTAESELEKLKGELTAREKAVADLTQAIQQERMHHSLEAQLRSAGAVDLDAALALAERSLAAKTSVAESDVADAIAGLKRMRPWLFRSEARRGNIADTGVMSAANDANASTGRTATLERAAGDAIATGNRIDLLRYLRLRRRRNR